MATPRLSLAEYRDQVRGFYCPACMAGPGENCIDTGEEFPGAPGDLAVHDSRGWMYFNRDGQPAEVTGP